MAFTIADGPDIAESGLGLLRQPSVVFVRQIPRAFEVDTGTGVLTGRAGDYLAYDPLTELVYVITAESIGTHYVMADSVLEQVQS